MSSKSKIQLPRVPLVALLGNLRITIKNFFFRPDRFKQNSSAVSDHVAKHVDNRIVTIWNFLTFVVKGQLTRRINEKRHVEVLLATGTVGAKEEALIPSKFFQHRSLDVAEQIIVEVDCGGLTTESIHKLSQLTSLSLGAPVGAGVNSSEPTDKGEAGALGYVASAPMRRNLR